ncbi:uncharacterized protein [Choristoneura fumiferana]|uniref:uncharacterized protein n=1 Tax=Choristoneura fumiferana TaxID=7141 RepID=UPI003D159C24
MFSLLRKYFSPFVRQKEELSLLQMFKPLYFLLAGIGLFPSAIEFPSGYRGHTVVLKSSSINLACTFLNATITCIFFCLHMQKLFSAASKNNSFTKDPMTLANYSTNLVIEVLVAIIVYICAFKNRWSHINILNEIAGCWADLSKSTRSVILGPLRVQVNCVVLGSLLVMLIIQLTVTFIQRVSLYNKALVAITFNFPEMLLFTVIAFYYVMIVMIVALLKNIDEHLMMIARMRMGNDNMGLKPGASLKSLRQLRGAYGRTMAAKWQVNAAFQASLLFILALTFHSLVCDAHGLYHIVAFHNDVTTLNMVVESFWVFYQVAKFYVIGYSSALLKLQVNKIGRTLHDISANIKDMTLFYQQIQHFVSLMKFQDSEITIYGLFQLKSSLLFSVVASAVTYLVILVQYDGGQ